MNARRRYLLYGLRVDSEIDLGTESEKDSGLAEIVIRLGDVPPPRQSTRDEEFARIQGLGAFHFLGGNEIVAALLPGVSADLLRVFIKGRAMAYLLRQRGWFPLHASAVQIGDGAVLFVGPVGTGKSTTAAAFRDLGHPLLSDDVCPLKQTGSRVTLGPGQSRLRLCPDAARWFSHLDPKAKFVFDKIDFTFAPTASSASIDVRKIYLLEDGAQLAITPVTSMEAASTIGRECFIRLKRAGPEMLAIHLGACAGIASLGIVHRLVRPRNLDRLAEVVRLVERDAGTPKWI